MQRQLFHRVSRALYDFVQAQGMGGRYHQTFEWKKASERQTAICVLSKWQGEGGDYRAMLMKALETEKSADVIKMLNWKLNIKQENRTKNRRPRTSLSDNCTKAAESGRLRGRMGHRSPLCTKLMARLRTRSTYRQSYCVMRNRFGTAWTSTPSFLRRS